jgi:hypothetical protein
MNLWIIQAKDLGVMHFFGPFESRDTAIEWGNRHLSMPNDWLKERDFDWRVAHLTDPDDYVNT